MKSQLISRNLMRRASIGCLLALWLIGSQATAQPLNPLGRVVPPATTQPAGGDQRAALGALLDIGGVLIHTDERQPTRPVILVDFTNHPEFQDDWLKHLAAFPQLSGVGLSGTRVSDNGLRHLRRCPRLETLSLGDTAITDAGLAELRSIKTLRHLDVRGTRVTSGGIEQLSVALPELEIMEGSLPAGNATGGAMPKEGAGDESGRRSEQPFTAREIQQLREKALELAQVPAGMPEGWSKSRVDPNRLLPLFAPLRLRGGMTLCAYQFIEHGNGNGVVWAMPVEAEFPEPDQCPRLEQHLFAAPKPFDALDDVMEAIEGDDSPRSYLAASLLRRELREFGALWHGGNWYWHKVLDNNPWQRDAASDDTGPSLDHPLNPRSGWKWAEAEPADWTPRVEMGADRVTVTFYTFSPRYEKSPNKMLPDGESIYRHTDTYRRGQYRARAESEVIAKAPGGVTP